MENGWLQQTINLTYQWIQQLDVAPWLVPLQWVLVGYFVCLSAGYLILNLVALLVMRSHIQSARTELLPASYASFLTPISVLVPAYNEQETIASSVLSLLQLTYPEYEVIVINDGSKDDTLQVLKDSFALTLSSATCPITFTLPANSRYLPVQPLPKFKSDRQSQWR